MGKRTDGHGQLETLSSQLRAGCKILFFLKNFLKWQHLKLCLFILLAASTVSLVAVLALIFRS